MKVQGILILFLAASLSGGCSPFKTIMREPQVLHLVTPEEDGPTQQPLSPFPLSSPTMEKNTHTPFVLPTQGDDLQMTPYFPGLQDLIKKAKEDLAIRLSVSVEEISVKEAVKVIWRDSSLGCPQIGMLYAQVLTPGYLILLEYADKDYEYHAADGPNIIYCTNPTPPLPGAPGDN